MHSGQEVEGSLPISFEENRELYYWIAEQQP